MRDFIWGYTQSGNRRHVVMEEAQEKHLFIGAAHCGAVIRKVVAEDQMQFWPSCATCQRLVAFLGRNVDTPADIC
ncbi:hypothetical protein LCGC14_0910050 [marine sediment metagenome]|uniref:Uncharacterized protein n=1 Tax=marine sediment metagenome TaxID=412755 RepID=A0A0F9NTY1_9ZZZZ